MNAEELLFTQREYFLKGHTRSAEFRIRQLKTLKRAVSECEPQILDAVAKDMGRPPHETYPSEVLLVLNEIDHALGYLASEMRQRRIRSPLMFRPGKSRVVPEPYGNALIIGPWNYPFQLLLSPLVGAMAAGNTAVLKTSEIAENSARVIFEMIDRFFDPRYIAVVSGSVDETQALLSQPFGYIFFTGSAAVGRIVMERASRHLIPVTLELGGKSPCIVAPDTCLETAARRICWGKFYNTGQTCVAPDYLLVHDSIKEPLLEALKKTITMFYGEDAKASPDYGRIISEKHFDRLCGLMEGQKIFSGGKIDRETRFIAPTILVDVDPDSPPMQEEIFGPLLPVLSYSSLEEAIDFINRRPKPLALYLFSESKEAQARILMETSSGGVAINETLSQVASTTLPFGGVGGSGMGRYHGVESFRTFSHYKSVLHRSIRLDARVKYPPYRTPFTILKRVFRLIS